VSRPDLYTVNGVLVLTGNMLAVLADALTKAERVRHTNGLPLTAGHAALADALRQAIQATAGRADVREPPTVSRCPNEQLTVAQAAERLTLSTRQVRRLAPRLGGRIVNGHGWLLDGLAVTEYAEHHKPH